MKVYITGFSATGKSAIVDKLGERGVRAFDIDAVPELCHWKNKESGKKGEYYPGIGTDWIEAHDWVCDEDALQKILDLGEETVVIAGIASNQKDYLKKFDKVFLLTCSEDTMRKRLNTRTGNNFGSDAKEQDLIVSWAKDFNKEYKDIGAIEIGTEQNIDSIVEKILDIIGL